MSFVDGDTTMASLTSMPTNYRSSCKKEALGSVSERLMNDEEGSDQRDMQCSCSENCIVTQLWSASDFFFNSVSFWQPSRILLKLRRALNRHFCKVDLAK